MRSRHYAIQGVLLASFRWADAGNYISTKSNLSIMSHVGEFVDQRDRSYASAVQSHTSVAVSSCTPEEAAHLLPFRRDWPNTRKPALRLADAKASETFPRIPPHTYRRGTTRTCMVQNQPNWYK